MDTAQHGIHWECAWVPPWLATGGTQHRVKAYNASGDGKKRKKETFVQYHCIEQVSVTLFSYLAFNITLSIKDMLSITLKCNTDNSHSKWAHF